MPSKSFDNADKLDVLNFSNNTTTFVAAISAPALSGTFFGDGSRLTGVGGTYTPPANATFTSSVSAPALSGVHFGDGSRLTGISTYTPPANATFTSSVSAPALSGTFFGDGSRLTGVVSTTNALPVSGGTLNGNLVIQNNLTVQGNLTALGITTFVNNTTYTVTSAFSITQVSPVSGSSALYVGQSGPADIASFFDIDQNIEVLHVGGVNSISPGVGVRTSNPNKTFTVNGEISASSDIWTGGKFRGDGSLLTGLPATYTPPANATFTSSVSAPALSGTFFGDGSRLTGVGGTYTPPANATFTSSVSAPALSGTFFGDGSRLTGVIAADSTKLPLSGGTLTGSVYISSTIFTETQNNLAQGVSTLSVDVSKASFFTLNLSTSITSLTFINTPVSPRVCSFVMQISADGTARAIAWPSSVRWPSNAAPNITSISGRVDTVSFLTYNGGTTWFGYLIAQNQ